jgi:hypothetical protein
MSEPRRESRIREALGGRSAVVVSLLAAIVTGAFTIGGAGVGYLQSKLSVDSASHQHIQDVERDACVAAVQSHDKIRLVLYKSASAVIVQQNGVLPISNPAEVNQTFEAAYADETKMWIIGSPQLSASLHALSVEEYQYEVRLISRSETAFTATDQQQSDDRINALLNSFESICHSDVGDA